MSAVLTDRTTPQAEVLVVLTQNMGDGLLGLWQYSERRLLRQDIEDYPTLYYKMD